MRNTHPSPIPARTGQPAARGPWLRAVALLALACGPAVAHHGSTTSYDVYHPWATWATVTEFNYINPHPTMKFDRTTSDGMVEHWVAEVFANPSNLARLGWTRKRSIDLLAPGTRVKLILGTSWKGGFGAVVLMIENEKGELIVSEREKVANVVDRDGVPGGLQPVIAPAGQK